MGIQGTAALVVVGIIIYLGVSITMEASTKTIHPELRHTIPDEQSISEKPMESSLMEFEISFTKDEFMALFDCTKRLQLRHTSKLAYAHAKNPRERILLFGGTGFLFIVISLNAFDVFLETSKWRAALGWIILGVCIAAIPFAIRLARYCFRSLVYRTYRGKYGPTHAKVIVAHDGLTVQAGRVATTYKWEAFMMYSIVRDLVYLLEGAGLRVVTIPLRAIPDQDQKEMFLRVLEEKIGTEIVDL